MTLHDSDTIVDRVKRVKHSLEGTGDPRRVQVAIDGPCPGPDCDGRVSATVHADTLSVHCDACGADYPV